jgi:predicted DNA-binding protein with PD1-like motif
MRNLLALRTANVLLFILASAQIPMSAFQAEPTASIPAKASAAGDNQRTSAPGMKVTELGKTSRTFEIVFDKGDEVMSGLADFASTHHIAAAHFSGVGTLDSALIQWGDPVRQTKQVTEVNQEVELVSFIGNMTTQNGKLNIHAHAVLGYADGSAKAGHFVSGRVSVRVQLFVVDLSN